MDVRKSLTGLDSIVALATIESARQLLVVDGAGRVLLVDVDTTANGTHPYQIIGSGYVDPAGIAIDESTGTVVVADADGMWATSLDDAGRATATPFATHPTSPIRLSVMGMTEGGLGVLVLESSSPARLDIYDLSGVPGDVVATRISGLGGAVDAIAAWGDRFAYVLGEDDHGVTLSSVDFLTSTSSVVVRPPHRGAIAWLDQSAGWLLVAAADGRLAAVSRDGHVNVLDASSHIDEPVVACSVLDGVAFLAGTSSVWEVELPVGLALPVQMTADDGRLFLGGFAPMRIDAPADIDLDDIDLVSDDTDVVSVSPSKDVTFDPGAPHVLVIGGWRSGSAEVRAVRRSSGEVVGRTAVAVHNTWNDDEVGPARCITGACPAPPANPAWGGGAPGPQNIDISPAPAAWRVAIVLLDTSDGRYTTATAATARTEYADQFANGVPVGGVTRSVIKYFDEVSYGKTKVSLVGGAVVGPVHLTQKWADAFVVETRPSSTNPAVSVPVRHNPAEGTWQAAVEALEKENAKRVAAGQPAVVDLANTDAVVFVVRTKSRPASPPPATPTATSIGEWVWPRQATATVKLKSGERTLPMVVMPDLWTAIDGRAVHTTLAHELGHTLGLPDLYLYPWMNAANAPREVGSWDLMHRDAPLPELSLPTRMFVGWVEASEVRSFNFGEIGANAGVNELVTLHALESPTVPAGRVRGAEIRIADGRNYYFEYRNRQVTTSQGDAALPQGGRRVMGTDVVSPKGEQSFDQRPYELRLHDDPDGVDDTDGTSTEGAFLVAGADYREQDFTERAPKDFVAEVVAVRDDSADLRIRYNSEAKPELSIRPWPNGEKRWQSPDIEIRNAKTADPRWYNTPWADNPNTIVAKVHNSGGLPAKGVRANISVIDFTTNGGKSGAEQPLGLTAPVDIPAGGTAELTLGWIPPAAGHYCIEVDIPLYVEQGNPAVHESSDRDNWAQSNYDQFWSATASPARRETLAVEVENVTPTRRPVYLRVEQTHPLHRVYVEHEWVVLDPGETRSVRVMVESLDGDPAYADQVEHAQSYLWEVPNLVNVSAFVRDACASQCVGGASLNVWAGRSTTVDRFGWDGVLFGHVSTVNPVDDVDNGTVVVTVRDETDDPATQREQLVHVDGHGNFQVEMGGLENGLIARAHYLGGYSYAPADSDPLRLEQ
jgi:M6 family metalloprotease-like protein